MQSMISFFRALAVASLAVASLALAASPAPAGWQLDNAASSLSFVSVKAGDLGEVHRFKTLSGTVSDGGAVELAIDLASVDTLIPIRDQRMREILFETAMFPTATLSGVVDMEKLLALGPGETARIAMPGELTLKTLTLDLRLNLLVARLSADSMLVVSEQPLIIDARSAGLADGLEQLRQIAGLPSISKAVPVSFVLTFSHQGSGPAGSVPGSVSDPEGIGDEADASGT